MVRKGTLKIEGVSPVQLNPIRPQMVKTVVNDTPKIMVDAMEMVKDRGDKILISNAMKLKETHSFKQVEELTGISMSTLKREAKKRKVQTL